MGTARGVSPGIGVLSLGCQTVGGGSIPVPQGEVPPVHFWVEGRTPWNLKTPMEDFHHVSLMSEDEKPWKRDLVRTAANRREQVAAQLETDIQAAPSFEEALRLAVDSLKKKFARYTAVSAYVADGEDLAMLTAANRPTGPERVGSGGPLADAARNPRSTMISNITEESAWKAVGLTVGSLLIAPVRTEAGLWAILEVWSDFRDSFTPQDQRLLERVATALGKKTPAA